jgi:hypothetical protein
MRIEVLTSIFMRSCLLCLVIAVLAGCIAPIQKLPTSSEAFHSSPDRLRAEYPEIGEYESFRFYSAYSEQLISVWGEPNVKRTEWSYVGYMGATLIGCGFLFGPVPATITAGLTVAIRPYPPEYYYWRKSDYCIEAKIDHTFESAYRGRLVRWKWHHLSDGKEIPSECK